MWVSPHSFLCGVGERPVVASTFELYRDEADEWRWRLRHDNGHVIADCGQGYSDKSGAKDGIESVRRDVPDAEIEELD